MKKLRIKIKYSRPTEAYHARQMNALAELFAPTLFAANREMAEAMAEARRIIDAPITEDSRASEIAELEAVQAAVNARLNALKGASHVR